MEAYLIEFLIIGALSVFGLFLIFYFIPVGTWVQVKVSGIDISFLELIMMRWRKVPPNLVVNALVALEKGGIKIDKDYIEAIFLAGGNIDNVTRGLIYAKASGIDLSVKEAFKLDMAKKDIVEELSRRH